MVWDRNDPEVKDIELKFRSTGVNIGGAEGTSVIISNKREENIHIELKVGITDLCGGQSSRTFTVAVRGKTTLGGNTWMGGMEQWDFQSKCTQRKEYTSGKKTMISDVDIKVLSVAVTGVTTEFKDSIDAVSINITKTKATNGKTNSIVRIKNNNQGKIAVVYVIADENIIYMPTHVNSGNTITIGAGSAERISYYVLDLLPEEAKDPGLIQHFKDFVRKKITKPPVTKASIKSRTVKVPCMCIR